ncbi:PP2C family protein-serine/threonine phosphatase [Nocardioides sp. HM23]|uniref:PP2C family protein-serine/threonine phosphatase n=1 Tax=Nocardioides bizhenqiangii TaxID=3095076 RepID=UPI002ACADED7|nr:PP2C family protein-serine/threonine phosphatase [Nocardioides sp. HM23]MDZ5620258.1 PP2C family protein-serine/threonine phosphatase [Nocardioides sp. HM23]
MDEAFLSGLRDLLQEQCRVPDLPEDWFWASAMLSAQGFEYGGDFFVSDLVETEDAAAGLAMVLVDVCGKGATALPGAVQFAGALRGLLVAVPCEELLDAANAFLLRQPSDESIATAVQVVVDLGTGRYAIRSAGHPPVLHWRADAEEWVVDNARGTALGVVDEPEFPVSEGVLAPGEALLFYTDGVVERPASDIDAGIDWLRAAAREAVGDEGMRAVPARIMEQVDRGDDDRALLVLARE